MFILLVSIKREIFTHICLALSLIVLRHIFSSMKFFQLCLSMHLTLFLPRQLETMTNVFTNILQQMYVDRNRANWDTEIYFKIFMDIYKIWRYFNSILAFCCFVFWDKFHLYNIKCNLECEEKYSVKRTINDFLCSSSNLTMLCYID